jgi:heat-inducible transcriptional repressor
LRSLSSSADKISKKQLREEKVLLGLVDLYIREGKPIGSNTLRDSGFQDLSSATIRNYFAALEEGGFLEQQHTSGGRVPTDKAYRLYANHFLDEKSSIEKFPDVSELTGPDELAPYLQKMAETLSRESGLAVFLSAPRFDHDYVTGVKIIRLDFNRALCVIITNFGMVHTEVLHAANRITDPFAMALEKFFNDRFAGVADFRGLEPDELEIAQQFYHEVMVRYIVGYSNFIDEDIYRTGLSNLLQFPEFADIGALASGLALFENVHSMRLILREAQKTDRMNVWVGSDLIKYSSTRPDCSVIVAPYNIQLNPVGAIGLLGHMRMPYRELFQLMDSCVNEISKALTRAVYHFKISYREPEAGKVFLPRDEQSMLEKSKPILLENKRVKE